MASWLFAAASDQVIQQMCGASGVDLSEVFTTDLASTPVHVAKWGFLGESWPFFRPNFVNMEQYRTDTGVDEVRESTDQISRMQYL